ncbi:MAG: hypothetical protein K0M45_12250 [Candidatus Paracaedibacteraceae bacterium]|nr:hypothetical protein [Candidatus Paracaedibacteraceae bacterium]
MALSDVTQRKGSGGSAGSGMVSSQSVIATANIQGNDEPTFYTFAKWELTYRKARHKRQTVTASLSDQGGQFVVVIKSNIAG